MNIIEIRHLRNGYYEERTRIVSNVGMKPGENPKEYVKRILKDGSVTDTFITKFGGRPHDIGHKI